MGRIITVVMCMLLSVQVYGQWEFTDLSAFGQRVMQMANDAEAALEQLDATCEQIDKMKEYKAHIDSVQAKVTRVSDRI